MRTEKQIKNKCEEKDCYECDKFSDCKILEEVEYRQSLMWD